MPLQFGVAWLTNPLGPLVWCWLPIILTANMVTDAFAGERERNTLETLLASRLPDHTILFGKMLASILYSWSLTLVSLLIGALTVNVTHPENGIRFYSLGLFLGTLGVSWMAGTLMAAGRRARFVEIAERPQCISETDTKFSGAMDDSQSDTQNSAQRNVGAGWCVLCWVGYARARDSHHFDSGDSRSALYHFGDAPISPQPIDHGMI